MYESRNNESLNFPLNFSIPKITNFNLNIPKKILFEAKIWAILRFKDSDAYLSAETITDSFAYASGENLFRFSSSSTDYPTFKDIITLFAYF